LILLYPARVIGTRSDISGLHFQRGATKTASSWRPVQNLILVQMGGECKELAAKVRQKKALLGKPAVAH
jgi:hypothetical protein